MNKNSIPFGAFLLRVTLRLISVSRGLLNVVVFTLLGAVEFFQPLGLSRLMTCVFVALELAGGAALILGLHTYLGPLALILLFWVAAVLVQVLRGDDSFLVTRRRYAREIT